VDGRNYDDAGVMLLGDDQALVFTTDFFTPVVDDPMDYGRIAAANALSDVYAMGGRPFAALNILGIPRGKVAPDIVTMIVRGAAEKCAEAGVAVLGGHSIRNPEPVFGMAVIGLAHPDRLLRNDAAKPGLDVVLTKPIGSGIITTAGMRDMAYPEETADAVRWMATLNKTACDAALACGSRAATDITGFGLLGHLAEIAAASGVTIEVDAARVPLMCGAARLLQKRAIPGGTVGNLNALNGKAHFPDDMPEIEQLLLCDAQTSGGLAIVVERDRTDELVAMLEKAGDCIAAVVGKTLPKSDHLIHVTGRVNLSED